MTVGCQHSTTHMLIRVASKKKLFIHDDYRNNQFEAHGYVCKKIKVTQSINSGIS